MPSGHHPLRFIWLILILTQISAELRAHRLDEYLQATLVEVETNHVGLQIRLVPGVEVSERVIGIVDSNHDGRISDEESGAYAERVRSDLLLQLDGQTLNLMVVEKRFPTVSEIREGVGTIHVRMKADTTVHSEGPHSLRFRNGHQRDLSVFLVNALLPASRLIQITSQFRDPIQSESRILFSYSPAGLPATPTRPEASPPARREYAGLLALLLVLISTAALFWTKNQLRRARAKAWIQDKRPSVDQDQRV